MNKGNPALLCDFYEFTMSNGYFRRGLDKTIVYFDLFYRNIPDGGGFSICAGLEQVIEYINDLHFDDDDIKHLRRFSDFDENFLEYLRNFRFTGDIYAVPEGTPVFPNEPVITVRAPVIEAQIIETFLLLTINHQSLIATKANRIKRAAGGRSVYEFGARRAHGADAAVYGARAAFIGGCKATSCTLLSGMYDSPVVGTMAHSWIQMFDSEYEAFSAYCQMYPEGTVLLVDTYDTLKSGVPNAIKVFKKNSMDFCGIRIDSGDISYLSKCARKMLDEAGLVNCRIIVSNSLDEYIIRDLVSQGAEIDSFAVGERLITSKSSPVFGGVYKLVAVEKDGEIIPKIKISGNVTKITTPHFKKLLRIYDKKTNSPIADLLCIHDEIINEDEPLTIFDPEATWKTKTITDFTVRELQVPVFINGEQVYTSPSISEIKNYCEEQVDSLWDEVKRFENPHKYYVDLSRGLWEVKKSLLENSADNI